MNDLVKEILNNNLRREQYCLSEYACKSSAGIRSEPEREKIADGENIRPTFFHDTDKIIHSLAYTRYIDKTQVFYLFENDNITHRVLHVQFVSKIARVIGRCLQLNEDLLEAISLGHDIGHVPYGHDGERYLNAIAKQRDLGYFCHNAQSVRSLMELENKGRGLNLTLQVLDGILCHNGELLNKKYEPDLAKDWDRFLAEYRGCWTSESFSRTLRPMTLEGCVMRIADIIAYIGRDIEDAITLKLIHRDDLPREATRVLGNRNDQIIDTLVTDLIEQSFHQPYLLFSDPVFEALNLLKRYNNEHIYKSPKKQGEDYKIKQMFQYLFDMYLEQLLKRDRNSAIINWINGLNDEYLQKNLPGRMVIDFISGMTDDYFNNQFKEACIPKSFGLYIKS